MIGPTDFRLAELAAEAKVKTCHIFHMLHWLSAGAPVEGFAKFAGLEAIHVERMMAALESHALVPKPKRRRNARAGPAAPHTTRLPPAMQLSDEWLSYAQEKRHWPEDTVREVFQDFLDHWCGKVDGKAVDWDRVWQGWVRRDRRPDGIFVPSVSPVLDDERRWIIEERARLNSGPWNAEGELEWVRRRDLAYR